MNDSIASMEKEKEKNRGDDAMMMRAMVMCWLGKEDEEEKGREKSRELV